VKTFVHWTTPYMSKRRPSPVSSAVSGPLFVISQPSTSVCISVHVNSSAIGLHLCDPPVRSDPPLSTATLVWDLVDVVVRSVTLTTLDFTGWLVQCKAINRDWRCTLDDRKVRLPIAERSRTTCPTSACLSVRLRSRLRARICVFVCVLLRLH